MSKSNCTACLPGSFAPYSATASCSPCPAGSFMSLAGWSGGSCTPCPGNTYLEGTGQSNGSGCVACPAGSSSPPGSASSLACVVTAPSVCPGGTFSSPGKVACQVCPAGSYRGAGEPVGLCTACPPGSYSVDVGSASSSSCVSCGPGTYNPLSGGAGPAVCVGCPPGPSVVALLGGCGLRLGLESKIVARLVQKYRVSLLAVVLSNVRFFDVLTFGRHGQHPGAVGVEE